MESIGGAVFAYLFRRISQKQLIAYIDDRQVSDRIVDLIDRDGYILKNCKLYAWAAYKARFKGEAPNYKEYGIDRVDVEFLSRLNLKHLKRSYESISLVDFDQLVQDVVNGSKIDTYIGKFISASMSFLLKSYGCKRDELEHDMKAKAIKTLYFNYPKYESLLHFENTAKTAIHNKGQSIITYHTAQGRQRLYVNQEGDFRANTVDLDLLQTVEAPQAYLSHIRDSLEVLSHLSEKMRPKVRRFLLAAAGQHDEEFSEYLEQDNRDAVESMAYSRYLSRARRFFGFSEDQVEFFFTKLRLHLQEPA